MFKKSTSIKCNAKNKTSCRYHGEGKYVTTQDYITATPSNLKDFQEVKELWEIQLEDRSPAKTLETPYTNETITYMPETKDNEEWQQGFICDKEGNAIGFIKIHNTDETWGNFHFKGIVLCDIQVNPAYKGQNVTLAILRKMKEHYNVNTIYSGETYSVTGYDMLMRLRGHSKSTGETLLTPQPYLVNKEHKITPSREEAYTFVKSWEEKQPKYRL